MNRNRQLSEGTYGKRHVQPHNPWSMATKSRSKIQHTKATRGGNPDGRANKHF